MSGADESLRVFCAIELPAELAARATEHIKGLRRLFPNTSASWNRDGKFHLTLKFIGEMPQAQVERLSLAAERATINLAPFGLVVAGAGCFPKKGAPRVLWLGIEDPAGQLSALHDALEKECAQQGFIRAERALHPHLTIARLRKVDGARELAAAHIERGFPPVAVSVLELSVIRSELSSQGSKYTLVSRHPLMMKS